MGINLTKSNQIHIHNMNCKDVNCKMIQDEKHLIPVTLQKKIIEYVWIYHGEHKITALLSIGLVCWRWFHLTSPLVDLYFTMYDDHCDKHHLTKYVKHLGSPFCLWKNVYYIACDVFDNRQSSRFHRHFESLKGNDNAIRMLRDVRLISINTNFGLLNEIIESISLIHWKSSEITFKISLRSCLSAISLLQLSKLSAKLPYATQFNIKYNAAVFRQEKSWLLNPATQLPKHMAIDDLSMLAFDNQDTHDFINTFSTQPLLSNLTSLKLSFQPDVNYSIFTKIKTLTQLGLFIGPINTLSQSQSQISNNNNNPLQSILEYIEQLPSTLDLTLSIESLGEEYRKTLESLKPRRLALTFANLTLKNEIKFPDTVETLLIKRITHPNLLENGEPAIQSRWITIQDNSMLRNFKLTGIPISSIDFEKIVSEAPISTLNINELQCNFEQLLQLNTLQSLTVTDQSLSTQLRQFLIDIEDTSNVPLLEYVNIKIIDPKRCSFPKSHSRFKLNEYTNPEGNRVLIMLNK